MARLLDENEVSRQLTDLEDWRLSGDGIVADFEFDDFLGSLAFINRIAALAEAAQHHPDIDIRRHRVHLALTSHDAGGLTQVDIELASQISAES